MKDQLINAQIAIKSAEVDYQNARVAREVAESAVTEFVEGTFKHELNAVKGEVALAESAIQKAERRRDRAREARQRLADLLASKKESLAPSDIVAELDIEDRLDASEQAILREKAALELAQVQAEILSKSTPETRRRRR